MNTKKAPWEFFAVKECPFCQVAHGVLEALGAPYNTHWYSWEELGQGLPLEKAQALGAQVPKKEVPFLVRGGQVLQDSLAIVLTLAPADWPQKPDFLLWRSADDIARLVYMLYALPEPMKGELAKGEWLKKERARIQEQGENLRVGIEKAPSGEVNPGLVAWGVWNRMLDGLMAPA